MRTWQPRALLPEEVDEVRMLLGEEEGGVGEHVDLACGAIEQRRPQGQRHLRAVRVQADELGPGRLGTPRSSR
jgi:hypothetical protein